MNRRFLLAAMAVLGSLVTRRVVAAADAQAPSFVFPSIDGGTLDTADWRGRPVLVVNTASKCGFTRQLDDMQKLHADWAPRGLVVLAVPSDDFLQEYGTAAEVKEFCEVNFGLTLPMTDIQHVARGARHPFYAWLRETHGFVPRWNFYKVLLDGEGRVVDTWGSRTSPLDDEIRAAFEPLLPRG